MFYKHIDLCTFYCFVMQIIMAKPAGGPKRDPPAGMDDD